MAAIIAIAVVTIKGTTTLCKYCKRMPNIKGPSTATTFPTPSANPKAFPLNLVGNNSLVKG